MTDHAPKYQNTPTVYNKGMPEGSFIFSDGKYDYCIVNGESLTKYYEAEYGAYESMSPHILADPMELLNDPRMRWMRTLLKYDSLSGTPKYKRKKELLESIKRRTEEDLF